VRGELSSACPILAEATNLLLGWDVSGDQEPEKSFRKWFLASWSLKLLSKLQIENVE